MARNDQLPPMGLALEEPSSANYFMGLIATVVACGALFLGGGYAWVQLSSGPCDELYDEALTGLTAEVDFLKESGTELGLNRVEIQELRASTQVAGESLEQCCQQHKQGEISGDSFQECKQHAVTMAGLPSEIIAARDDPAAAKQAIRNAANRLRAIAGDLTDIASRSEPGAAAGVAAGPPSED